MRGRVSASALANQELTKQHPTSARIRHGSCGRCVRSEGCSEHRTCDSIFFGLLAGSKRDCRIRACSTSASPISVGLRARARARARSRGRCSPPADVATAASVRPVSCVQLLAPISRLRLRGRLLEQYHYGFCARDGKGGRGWDGGEGFLSLCRCVNVLSRQSSIHARQRR